MDLSENECPELDTVATATPEIFEQFLIEKDIPHERIDRMYAAYVELCVRRGCANRITSRSRFVADLIAKANLVVKRAKVFQAGPFLVNIQLKANR